MTGKPFQPFKSDAKFPTPEAAARELLRIYQARIADGWPHTYTGVTNADFLQGGGSVDEYRSGRAYGIEQGWFKFDESGTRITIETLA